MNTVKQTPTPFKVKLILISFGLILGLVGLEGAMYFIGGRIPGTEFSSLDDLRRAMLRPDKSTDGSGPLSLRSIVNPHPNDRIIYDLRPNLDVKFQRAQVTTNSCGMRDTETSITKDPDTYRIALLGDSFSFGWGVEQNETFAQVLEDNLNRVAHNGKRVEVLNFGVPGYSTFQELEKLIETGLDFDPDVLLVFFIENDFGYPFYVRDVLNPGGGILSSSKFVQLAKDRLHPELEDQRIQLLGLDANRSLLRLSDVARERGIPLMLAINPKRDWQQTRKKLWALQQRQDIQVLQLRKAFMKTFELNKYSEKELTLSFDPHPSALKHRILGDILTPYFMEAVG